MHCLWTLTTTLAIGACVAATVPVEYVQIRAAAAPRQAIQGFGWSLVRGTAAHHPLGNLTNGVSVTVTE
jgi:hypothetical protein